MKAMQYSKGSILQTTLVMLMLVLIVLVSFFSKVNASCENDQSTPVKFSILTRRNATAHRNIYVYLESQGRQEFGEAYHNSIVATQTVKYCNGTEVIMTSAEISVRPGRMLSHGYDVFPGLGHYKFFPKSVTWNEAHLACVAEGSQLFVANSEAESNVAKQYLNRKITIEAATWSGWMWSGFHDRGLEGSYETVYGEYLNKTGYTKWHPGQPDNKPWGIEPDQDCGSINKDGYLNDLPCTGKLPFMCEQPM